MSTGPGSASNSDTIDFWIDCLIADVKTHAYAVSHLDKARDDQTRKIWEDTVKSWEAQIQSDKDLIRGFVKKSEVCEHGLSASLCAGPQHYPYDEDEVRVYCF